MAVQGTAEALLPGCANAFIYAVDVIADPTTIRLAPIDTKWTVRKVKRELSITATQDADSTSKIYDFWVVTVKTSNREATALATGGFTVQDVLTGGSLGQGPMDVLDVHTWSGVTEFGQASNPMLFTGRVDNIAHREWPWHLNVQRKLQSDEILCDLWCMAPRTGYTLPQGATLSMRWNEVISVLWQRTMSR